MNEIRQRLTARRFEFTRHALKRVVERDIGIDEIVEAGAGCTFIEEYPDDKYSPSALALGFTRTGRPLHLQVSLNESDLVRIITLYEPDPDEWFDNRTRR